MKPKFAITSNQRISQETLKRLIKCLKPYQEEMDFLLLDNGLSIEALPQVSAREYFAGQAMSGMLARGDVDKDIINESIEWADNMIECLKEK